MPDISTPPADAELADVPSKPAWTDRELHTLLRFRRRVGRTWKSKLLDLYLSGKDDDEPDGPGLRHIRNRQGPSRVHALTASTLNAAERRLNPVGSHNGPYLRPRDQRLPLGPAPKSEHLHPDQRQ